MKFPAAISLWQRMMFYADWSALIWSIDESKAKVKLTYGVINDDFWYFTFINDLHTRRSWMRLINTYVGREKERSRWRRTLHSFFFPTTRLDITKKKPFRVQVTFFSAGRRTNEQTLGARELEKAGNGRSVPKTKTLVILNMKVKEVIIIRLL